MLKRVVDRRFDGLLDGDYTPPSNVWDELNNEGDLYDIIKTVATLSTKMIHILLTILSM